MRVTCTTLISRYAVVSYNLKRDTDMRSSLYVNYKCTCFVFSSYDQNRPTGFFVSVSVNRQLALLTGPLIARKSVCIATSNIFIWASFTANVLHEVHCHRQWKAERMLADVNITDTNVCDRRFKNQTETIVMEVFLMSLSMLTASSRRGRVFYRRLSACFPHDIWESGKLMQLVSPNLSH